MRKSILLISLVCILMVFSVNSFAQPSSPIAGSKTVLVDQFLELNSDSYITLQYRCNSNHVFFEPVTGNIVIGYRLWDDPADEGVLVMHVSTDNGDTWIKTDRVNDGLANTTNMDGGYTGVVWGNEATPIILFTNRGNDDQYIEYEPYIATDLFGWGGGITDAVSIDSYSGADTVNHYRYLDFVIAPDDPNLWLATGWHNNNADPGEYLAVWRSTDAGMTWSRPKVPVSAVAADAGQGHYYYNIMSSSAIIEAGPNGMVYIYGETQKDSSGDIYRGVYSMSADGGVTWTDPAIVPGTENNSNNLNDITENKMSIVDQAGNWHLVQGVRDTTDTLGIEYYIHCLYNGSTWAIQDLATPMRPGIHTNGLTRRGRRAPTAISMNAAGTIYFTYMDVFDTTGGYDYNVYAKYTEDNGATWKGPVHIGDGFNTTAYASDVSRNVGDYMHIMYNIYDDVVDTLNKVYYMAIPAAGIVASGVNTTDQNLPEEFDLKQNYPNPFNPTTTIEFSLAKKTHVNISIFNSLGQKVETLVDYEMTAGKKAVVWYARGKPSGTYYYKMKTGDTVQTKEMVLVK